MEIAEPEGQKKVHDPEWDQEDIGLLNKIKQARTAFPEQPPVQTRRVDPCFATPPTSAIQVRVVYRAAINFV